ncbi:phage tail protein [Oryzobacter telluris]|uniref:phage tail protein n=1 Tax=Oryzobacter telluris TaxID=3149179 RepID=UPI00370D80D3
MAASTRHDSGLAHAFTVTADGVQLAGVTGVSGIGVERDAIEFREGNDDSGTRRLPGRAKGGDAVLTRGLSTDPAFESWARAAGADGAAVATRDVRIRFFDRHGAPVRAYRLVRAWPRRFEVAGSTTAGSPGLLEVLTLSYDACVPE